MDKIVFGVHLVSPSSLCDRGTLHEDPEAPGKDLSDLYTTLKPGSASWLCMQCCFHCHILPPRSGSYLTGIKGLGLFLAFRFCACLNPHWVQGEKIQTCA